MDKGVILLSGGLDSTTLLAWVLASRLGPRQVTAVSLNYGQRHLEREIPAARVIADYYQVEHRVILMDSSIFHGAKSTLVGQMIPNPHMTYKELAEAPGVSPTYVPFRNAIFLSMATAYALTIGAGEVYMGVHAEDARNWAYPDCTPEFTGSMANAIYVGTYHKVRLVTPFSWLMKKEVVSIGLNLEVPYQFTWTCYEGGSIPCGQCPSCIERENAFHENGALDPATKYIGGR